MTTPAAAGGVLWRGGPGTIEIALIHRPRYDDWSLPKGKIEPHETPPVAAVREIAEETGLMSTLGRFLTTVEYSVPKGLKRVHYWSARAGSGDFRPNDEVDKLIWLPPDQAMTHLSYLADRAVVADFDRLPTDTHTTLLVRHAKAGSRQDYRGKDTSRPLEKTGRAQAVALVPNLLAFGAVAVHSADPVRCTETVTPLAAALGVTIVDEPTLSETAYAADPDAAFARIQEFATLPTVRAVCSQGKVIPHLLRHLAADHTPLQSTPTRKGSFWVLSWHHDRLIAADYLPPPGS